MSFVLFLLSLVVVVVLVLYFGRYRLKSNTQSVQRLMESAREPITPATVDLGEVESLPEPVQRYFRKVLNDGQPMIEGATLKQIGTFNLSQMTEHWMPFTATQTVVTQRPGFDWDAKITARQRVEVNVRDAYVAGEGVMQVSFLGLLSMANVRGTPEAAEGELMRFFAECVWYPTRLLPSQGMRWEAVDDHSANATIQDGNTEITLLFRFNQDDLIESVRSESRSRLLGNEVVQTPWEGQFSDYQEQSGMLIPMQGEVAWVLEDKKHPYWRGDIRSIQYRFAT